MELDSTLSITNASWTGRLLGRVLEDWGAALRQLAVGLGLSAIFGLALGVRYGAPAMLVGGGGVPLAFVAVAALAAPAFFIGVSHANLPISGLGLAAAVSRGVATAGLVLAGLAPAATMLLVTAESDVSAALIGMLGLATGGALGMRTMMATLRDQVSQAEGLVARGWSVLRWCFALFATVLAARIWWLALPMLGRGAL